jgi:hypothetical protein
MRCITKTPDENSGRVINPEMPGVAASISNN